MAKIKSKTQKKSNNEFFLRLVIFLILGFIWVQMSFGAASMIPIPIGLAVGLFILSKSKLKTDNKIEYAVLLTSMVIGLVSRMSIYIRL